MCTCTCTCTHDYMIVHAHTSTKSAQCFCSLILSPLANVNSLLSSITEFMFSTQRASTSPSNRIYLRSFLSVGLLMSLNILDKSPSVQSLVIGSRIPYSSTTVTAFGLRVYSLVTRPNLERKRDERGREREGEPFKKYNLFLYYCYLV